MKINKKKSQIKKVKFGKNVTIIEPVNLYECEIGDNCFISSLLKYRKMCLLIKIPEFKAILSYVKMLKLEKIAL